jgi:hypothetical protein
MLIIFHILKEIRSNQITGGFVRYVQSSITQRLNNLKEETDITSGGDKIQSNDIKIEIIKPKDN